MAAILLIGGTIVAIGATLGGFMMGGGKPMQLIHPGEIIIIAGIATSIVLISSPFAVLTRLIKDLMTCVKGVDTTKERFTNMLQLLYEILQVGRRKGYIAMDEHIGDPESSSIFSKYPTFLADPVAVEFLCSALRPLVDGKIKPDQIDAILQTELKSKVTEANKSAETMMYLMDSMPGVGIVAALMGIINTMSDLSDPGVIAKKISAALSGTFLGIFSAYALFGPLGVLIKHNNSAAALGLDIIRVSIASFAKGLAPAMAVDVSRRALPSNIQPSGDELEELIKQIKQS